MNSPKLTYHGIDDTKQDYLFYTASAWMHWSSLNTNWEPAPDINQVSKIQNAEKQQRSVKEIVIQPSLAYLCGSIGHGLTLVTKIVGIALFFFLSIGFGAYFAFSKLQNILKQSAVSDNLMEKRTFYFLMSGITFVDSIVAAGVDTIGIACPPIAYKIHKFLHQHLVKLIIGNNIAYNDINEKMYDATNTFRILLDPSSLENYAKQSIPV